MPSVSQSVSLRIALPPVGNYVVGLLKDTSIASIIAAPELMLRAKDLASSSFMPMQLYVLAAVIYFFMSFPLAILIRRLERRSYRMHVRVLLARYRAYLLCPECNGSRLKADALNYRIHGKDIAEINAMNVGVANEFFGALKPAGVTSLPSRTIAVRPPSSGRPSNQ